MDTQWPRYLVFQQRNVGEPHQFAGSVHAPDAEMALMNARDVFVRRPACVSLWIVPAKSVFAKTAEELDKNPTVLEVDEARNKPEKMYCVFQKATHKGTYIYLGDMAALSPAQALKTTFDSLAQREATGWWVVPAAAITRTTPDDIEALFQPASSKPFRDQAFYHTVAAMRAASQSQHISTPSQDTNIDEP